jgi:hypothetical protein
VLPSGIYVLFGRFLALRSVMALPFVICTAFSYDFIVVLAFEICVVSSFVIASRNIAMLSFAFAFSLRVGNVVDIMVDTGGPLAGATRMGILLLLITRLELFVVELLPQLARHL